MSTKPSKKSKSVGRRDFLKSAAIAGAGLIILPGGVWAGPNAPSNKLNVAMIGTWGPANAWRPAITVSWYQGGAMPKSPSGAIDLNKIGHGVMFKGAKGHIVADFGTRMLLPWGGGADMTYYKPRTKDKVIPPMGGFQQEWINACKGDKKTSCDFEYSGNMIEQMLLGLVAYRVGEKLQYDGSAGKVTNNAKANELLARQYRQGWTLDG
jgi:hypothetical protein